MNFSFTFKYLFGLIVIALFSIMAYFNLVELTKAQEDDGEIINKSGRQRMLSQKIALFTLQNSKIELEQSINLMKKSHKYLTSKTLSKKMKDIYFSESINLDKAVNLYLKESMTFVKTRSDESRNYILNNSQKLLKKLDLATSIYQAESDLRVKNLQKNELYIILLTLFTLVLEAIFIYRPADNSIKKKTQELISQSKYLDVVTQINTNAIIAIDDNFNILTFNKSAEKIFGYSAKEMLYTKLIDDRIIPLKYLKQHNIGLKNFATTGKLKHNSAVFELEAQNKNKEIFPIRISFGVKIEDGLKIIVANIQDITHEKEKDNIIIQQSRLAAMGEMIGNIAHQWRQPLSSISTIATGAKLRYKNNLISDEELVETFDKIKEHTQYLSKTIDDFRDFLQQNTKQEVFNVIDIINKSITLIEAAYKNHSIETILDFSVKQLMINGSGSQLSQVFLNILNNAKDILVEQDIENKVVFIEVLKDGNSAVINIHDNAGGIPEDIKVQIFEPYFTTKHKSQGTGIGLFMSKRIIEQNFDGVLKSSNKEFVVNDNKFFGASFSIVIDLAQESKES